MAKIEHKLGSPEGNPLTHASAHLGKTLRGIRHRVARIPVVYLKISFRPSGICFLYIDKVGTEPLVPFMMYAVLMIKIPRDLLSPISNSPTQYPPIRPYWPNLSLVSLWPWRYNVYIHCPDFNIQNKLPDDLVKIIIFI